MVCRTPQMLFEGQMEPCGCCEPCRMVKTLAERQRKFYWVRRRKGASHV